MQRTPIGSPSVRVSWGIDLLAGSQRHPMIAGRCTRANRRNMEQIMYMTEKRIGYGMWIQKQPTKKEPNGMSHLSLNNFAKRRRQTDIRPPCLKLNAKSLKPMPRLG